MVTTLLLAWLLLSIPAGLVLGPAVKERSHVR